MEDSDNCGMRSIERPNNASLGPPIIADVGNFHQYTVAVHRWSDRMRRNKDISRKPGLQVRGRRSEVRNHKSESIAVKAEFPRDEVFSRRGLRNRVSVRVNGNQLTAGNQFLQPS